MVKKTKTEKKTRKKLNYILYTLGTYILIYIIYKERTRKEKKIKEKNKKKHTCSIFSFFSSQNKKQASDRRAAKIAVISIVFSFKMF